MNKSIKNALRIGLMGAAGGAAGYFSATSTMNIMAPVFDALHPAWLLLLLPAAAFSAILIHETGHSLAGISRGFSFSFLTALFLRIEKKEGRLSAAWNRIPATWGGLAMAIPPSTVSRTDYLWFVAGGPLASLLMVVVSGAGLWASYPHWPAPAAFFAVSLLINGLIAPVTMMPVKFDDNFDTDGIQFLDLLRGGDRARRKLAVARLMSEAMSGIRPSAYPEALLAEVERPGPPDRDTLVAALFRISGAMDRNDWNGAGERLQTVLANLDVLPPLLHREVHLMAATVNAFLGRVEESKQWLDRAGDKGYAEKASVSLARAAYAVAAAKADEARLNLTALNSEIPAVQDPGSRLMLKDLSAELAARAAALHP